MPRSRRTPRVALTRQVVALAVVTLLLVALALLALLQWWQRTG